MSHRLQVLIPEELDLALAQAAARERVSKGEFVRSAIEAALAQRIADADPVATLAGINAPTADIEQMVAEIDARYG
ncbi:MAG: ribbon-helix-helix protein, CopG family [Micrococcales bacterium]|nr:ribbon-helix-helix protein, CopG family [Micrococcales bacterium]